jgi:hypothetical protein
VSLLVDTNVVSELREGSRANPHVLAWFMGVAVLRPRRLAALTCGNRIVRIS